MKRCIKKRTGRFITSSATARTTMPSIPMKWNWGITNSPETRRFPRSGRAFDADELDQLLSAVSVYFTIVIFANLTKNCCYIMGCADTKAASPTIREATSIWFPKSGTAFIRNAGRRFPPPFPARRCSRSEGTAKKAPLSRAAARWAGAIP